jgi:hypothetical protein
MNKLDEHNFKNISYFNNNKNILSELFEFKKF